MSRTVRCKNLVPGEDWLVSREEYDRYISTGRKKRPWRNWDSLMKNTFEETRKAELTVAHTDHGHQYFFTNPVPSGFRRDLNSWRRVTAKQELQISVLKDLGETYLPYRPRDLKDLLWFWD